MFSYIYIYIYIHIYVYIYIYTERERAIYYNTYSRSGASLDDAGAANAEEPGEEIQSYGRRRSKTLILNFPVVD